MADISSVSPCVQETVDSGLQSKLHQITSCLTLRRIVTLMKVKFSVLSLLAACAVAACFTVSAVGQDDVVAHPMYKVGTPNLHADAADAPPVTPLTTWNGSFTYLGSAYHYNMVGTAPSTGTSTTVKTFLIPIALKFSTGQTYTPATLQSNGKSAVTNTADSPIYQSMDFVTPKGTDLGTTQYEDAFQRGNFNVAGTGYHVLLSKPVIAPVFNITVPATDGKVRQEFGITVGTADYSWFDSQVQAIMKKYPTIVTPNTFPVFIIYDTYLTELGGAICCIGGYHNSFGSVSAPQAYGVFSYIGTPGIFAQDVSALSHEAGEWMDDPLVVNTNGNPVACGILEVGDPEESYSNYGAFPYTLNGFTYNLQDLVYLEYFGAPTTTSVDGGALSFHDNPFGLGVCSNGG